MSRHEVGRGLLRWYPPTWRARYGDELVTLMADQTGGRRPPLSMQLGVIRAGLRERAQHAGLAGDTRPPAERVRAGALLVLCGWTILVLGGAVFQKSTEHFQSAVSGSARPVAVAAFDVVVLAAVAGAGVLAAGVLAALPAGIRVLRQGGWHQIRRLVTGALLATTTESVLLGALVAWAHAIPASHRNGGWSLYTGAFLGMALLTAVMLTAWTAVAVACARRIEMSPRLLRVESALAVGLFALIAVVAAASALWWGSLGSASSAFEPALALSMALMLAAVAVSSAGVARIVRSRTGLRPASSAVLK